MSYIPRPDPLRREQDVDAIYDLAADALLHASTAERRRTAFRQALLQAYDAGVDAQRGVLQDSL